MFGDIINKVLETAENVADELGRINDNAGNILPSQVRSLNPSEMTTISNVFAMTLVSSNLRITNGEGADGRPWCSPSLVPGQYYLNLGPTLFTPNLAGTSLLVHESTHAWQGLYGVLPVSYLAGSAHCQAVAKVTSGSTSPAYSYSGQENMQFFQYNIEQQASIIAHWATAAFMAKGDWRFRYIRDNIRTGNPNAISQPIVPAVQLPVSQLNRRSPFTPAHQLAKQKSTRQLPKAKLNQKRW